MKPIGTDSYEDKIMLKLNLKYNCFPKVIRLGNYERRLQVICMEKLDNTFLKMETIGLFPLKTKI